MSVAYLKLSLETFSHDASAFLCYRAVIAAGFTQITHTHLFFPTVLADVFLLTVTAHIAVARVIAFRLFTTVIATVTPHCFNFVVILPLYNMPC